MARFHMRNGVNVPFTAQEEIDRDAEEEAYTAKEPERALEKFNTQRRDGKTDPLTGELIAAGYGSVHSQLAMQYDDMINGTTIWKDHVLAVKLSQPKP